MMIYRTGCFDQLVWNGPHSHTHTCCVNKWRISHLDLLNALETPQVSSQQGLGPPCQMRWLYTFQIFLHSSFLSEISINYFSQEGRKDGSFIYRQACTSFRVYALYQRLHFILNTFPSSVSILSWMGEWLYQLLSSYTLLMELSGIPLILCLSHQHINYLANSPWLQLHWQYLTHRKEEDPDKLHLLCYFSIPFYYVLLSLYVFVFWTS